MPASAARPINAAEATGALMVEECDIPAGMTLAEYRRSGTPLKPAKRQRPRPRLRGASRLRLG